MIDFLNWISGAPDEIADCDNSCPVFRFQQVSSVNTFLLPSNGLDAACAFVSREHGVRATELQEIV